MDTSWIIKALDLARSYEKFSDDNYRKVAAVALKGERDTVVGFGVNRFPKRIQVTLDRMEKSFRSNYMLHAEEVLVTDAGRSLEGSTCILTYFPCLKCARLLIECEVKAVIAVWDDRCEQKKEQNKFELAEQLMLEADLIVIKVDPSGIIL